MHVVAANKSSAENVDARLTETLCTAWSLSVCAANDERVVFMMQPAMTLLHAMRSIK